MIPSINNQNLRNYQISHKNEIYEKWKKHKSIMLQMPTGTGKTRLFASIVRDIHDYGASQKKALKVLILVHREELVHQTSETLGVTYGVAHGIIMAKALQQDYFPTQIASVQTINNRLNAWGNKNFDFIIIDEAHHSLAPTYVKICKTFPDAHILGVTATPVRMNGTGFKSLYKDLIISKSVSEFIMEGYLSKYDYFSISPNSAIQKAINNIDTFDVDGDYAIAALSKTIDTTIVQAKIIGAYEKYAKGKKGIVYTINKAHNKHVCEAYQNAGYNAKAIDSDTSSTIRAKIIQEFKQGKVQILCNVNIFSEGFDCPDVEFIQLARPTMSLGLYLQQVGRGLRPHPDIEKVIFLDNVGSYNKYGLPSSYRNWHRSFNGLPQETKEIEKSSTPYVKVFELQDEEEIFIEGNKPIELIYTSPEVDNPELNGLIQFDGYSDFFVPDIDKTPSGYHWLHFDFDDWSTSYSLYNKDYLIEDEGLNVDDDEDDHISELQSAIKLVTKLGKKGLYDIRNNLLLLDLDYDEIQNANILGYCIVSIGNKYGIYSLTKSKIILPCEYDSVEFIKSEARYNQFIVEREGKSGIVDEDNLIVIPIEFYDLFLYQHGFFPSKNTLLCGRLPVCWCIIDDENQLIYNLTSLESVGQFGKVEYNGYHSLVNEQNFMLLPPIFESIKMINNLIFAKTDRLTIYIYKENLEDFIDEPCTKYEFVKNKILVVRFNKRIKVLSIHGSSKLDFQCEEFRLKNGVLYVQKDKNWHVIDLDGQILESGAKLKELDKKFRLSPVYLAGAYKGIIELEPTSHTDKKANKTTPSTKPSSKLEELKKFINEEIKVEDTISQEITMAKKKRPRIKRNM